MPNTPSGTRMRPTEMPLGRRFSSLISPIGSASAATCSQPSAICSIDGVGEPQPVDHRRRQAGVARGGEVGLVGLAQRLARFAQAARQGEQRGVLGGSRRGGHRRAGGAGRGAEAVHRGGDVGSRRVHEGLLQTGRAGGVDGLRDGMGSTRLPTQPFLRNAAYLCDCAGLDSESVAVIWQGRAGLLSRRGSRLGSWSTHRPVSIRPCSPNSRRS